MNIFIGKEFSNSYNKTSMNNTISGINQNLRKIDNNFNLPNNKTDFSSKELNYGLIKFAIFHFLVVMILICMSMTILKNPGFLETKYVIKKEIII